jgi:dinuclear metal center YbgI/SA1388 family protein
LLTVKKVISYLEEIAPPSLALPGDPVGLQLGNPGAEVKRVMVSLDPDIFAVREALESEVEMLVTHHPLFFHKLSSIDESRPIGALVSEAVRGRLNIYSAHTNFDIAPEGVTYHLAKAIGLPTSEADVLEVTGSEQLLKLVVFVPAGYEDKILKALAGAGAGQTGRYSHCSFQAVGTGTFMPEEGTTPFIGASGAMEKVDEMRLETILPATRRAGVLSALIKAHPYEEVAYDLYPLDLDGKKVGLGLLINSDQSFSLEKLVQLCRKNLTACNPRGIGFGKSEFRKIALCGGSGGSLIEHAAGRGAEILISGDFRYHDLKQAEELGLALIDAGHAATEIPAVQFLCQSLRERLKKDGFEAEVLIKTSTPTGWIHF